MVLLHLNAMGARKAIQSYLLLGYIVLYPGILTNTTIDSTLPCVNFSDEFSF